MLWTGFPGGTHLGTNYLVLARRPKTSFRLFSCSDGLLLKLCDQSVGVNRSSGNDTPQCKSTTEYVPHAGPSNTVPLTKPSVVGVWQSASSRQAGWLRKKQKSQADRSHTTKEEKLDPNPRRIKTQPPIIAHEEWMREGHSLICSGA